MLNRSFNAFLLIFILLFSLQGKADLNQLLGKDSSDAEFLPVEQAFSFSGRTEDGKAYIDALVTPGHYLYKHQFSFTAIHTDTLLGSPEFPEGESVFDPYYKKNLETYPTDFTIGIPIETNQPLPEITIAYQGCAKAGLCYPPAKITIPLIVNADKDSVDAINSMFSEAIQPVEAEDAFYQDQLKKSALLAVALFFLAGIGLSFTPCVLPMFPILSSLILGSKNSSRSKIIALTLAYVFSMSATFALAGTLTGLFGASLNLQARLQSPWLIAPMALLFVLLALSMFGLYELQLPARFREKLDGNEPKRGSVSGAAVMGVLSALVVSPCVSAPLAGALVYISTTGNAALGGISLFALGLGMGIPLLLIGFGGRHILPKAGNWMNGIRNLFGVLLLGVAIWMMERIIPASVTLFLWGTLLIGCSAFLYDQKNSSDSAPFKLKRAAGIILLVYGISLVIGAAMGNSNPFKPLNLGQFIQSEQQKINAPNDSVHFLTVSSVIDLNTLLKEAANNHQAVMVDISADWCISCKIMERTVFPAPQVKEIMSAMTLIKMDITDNTAEHQSFLNQYQLFGPPALLFFTPKGVEAKALRTQGEVSVEQLQQRLNSLPLST